MVLLPWKMLGAGRFRGMRAAFGCSRLKSYYLAQRPKGLFFGLIILHYSSALASNQSIIFNWLPDVLELLESYLFPGASI